MGTLPALGLPSTYLLPAQALPLGSRRAPRKAGVPASPLPVVRPWRGGCFDLRIPRTMQRSQQWQ
jgi:hypothetical protein